MIWRSPIWRRDRRKTTWKDFSSSRALPIWRRARARTQIAKFGKSRYNKYHGSEEGWSDLLALTATTTLPPADFTITKYVPPTPAEQAADLVKSKKIEEMSFAEWQMVLSEGTPEDAERCGAVLKGKPLQMVAHIISIDCHQAKPATKLILAGSADDIDAKRADIDLTMSAAIPAKQMPKEDTDFQFEGTPVSYVAKPFVMTMNDGALLVKSRRSRSRLSTRSRRHTERWSQVLRSQVLGKPGWKNLEGKKGGPESDRPFIISSTAEPCVS